MPDPAAIGNYFSGMWSGAFASIMRWGSYVAVSVLILTGFTMLYLLMQYKFKVKLHKIEGNTVSKPKWERARIIKKDGIVKWRLLLRRKTIKPVDFRYIYPGNKVYLLQTGQDMFIPMREESQLLLDESGETVTQAKTIQPLDEDVTYWYQLQQQQIARDYLPDDAGKKQLYLTIGTIVLCLILCGFTVWLVLKNIQSIAATVDSAATKAQTLKNIANGLAPN